MLVSLAVLFIRSHSLYFRCGVVMARQVFHVMEPVWEMNSSPC